MSQDSKSLIVIPIVQNELQDVSIRSSQHLIEETATDYGAALVYMSFAKNVGSLAHDMRLIEWCH
jgi:hypothetical protein